MKIIQKISFESAKYISQKLGHNNQKRAVLYFGFQGIYGDVSKLSIIILVSLILKSLLPSLIIAITFAFLRKKAGGFHMKTEAGCTLFTLCICVIPGTMIRYLSLKASFTTAVFAILAIYVFCFICLLKYAPRGSKNRTITDIYEIREFKKKSVLSLIFLAIICMIFVFLTPEVSISICVGCLLEVITITPFVCDFIEEKKTSNNIDCLF